jgi:hypothetical protein
VGNYSVCVLGVCGGGQVKGMWYDHMVCMPLCDMGVWGLCVCGMGSVSECVVVMVVCVCVCVCAHVCVCWL